MICKRCGKEVIGAGVNRIYCNQCSRERRIEYQRNYNKSVQSPGRKTAKGRTIAICPMCGKKYKTTVRWTGHGTPRIHCNSCRATDVVSNSGYITYSFI
jgi:hypothetical protein